MTPEMSGGVAVCGCSLLLAASGNHSDSPQRRLTDNCVGAYCSLGTKYILLCLRLTVSVSTDCMWI